MQREMVMQCFRVYRRIHAAGRQQGLRGGSKADAMFILSVIKRFDAQPVARQKDLASQPVPYREGEGAMQMNRTLIAPFDIGAQDDFGIAIGMEGMTLGHEFRAQLRVVVDGSVEHQSQTCGFIHHGLAGTFGEINDGQAAVAERNATIEKQAITIRPAPGQFFHHALQDRLIGRQTIETEFTRDATHVLSPCCFSNRPQRLFLHQRDLFAQFKDAILPVMLRVEPGKRGWKCRVVPASSDPG